MCMFCRSLFVPLSLFLWPLCCLSFFDLRILITPLVYSNSSYHSEIPCIDGVLEDLFRIGNSICSNHFVFRKRTVLQCLVSMIDPRSIYVFITQIVNQNLDQNYLRTLNILDKNMAIKWAYSWMFKLQLINRSQKNIPTHL